MAEGRNRVPERAAASRIVSPRRRRASRRTSPRASRRRAASRLDPAMARSILAGRGRGKGRTSVPSIRRPPDLDVGHLATLRGHFGRSVAPYSPRVPVNGFGPQANGKGDRYTERADQGVERDEEAHAVAERGQSYPASQRERPPRARRRAPPRPRVPPAGPSAAAGRSPPADDPPDLPG